MFPRLSHDAVLLGKNPTENPSQPRLSETTPGWGEPHGHNPVDSTLVRLSHDVARLGKNPLSTIPHVWGRTPRKTQAWRGSPKGRTFGEGPHRKPKPGAALRNHLRLGKGPRKPDENPSEEALSARLSEATSVREEPHGRNPVDSTLVRLSETRHGWGRTLRPQPRRSPIGAALPRCRTFGGRALDDPATFGEDSPRNTRIPEPLSARLSHDPTRLGEGIAFSRSASRNSH